MNQFPPAPKEDPSPDSWIDLYCAGLERPLVRGDCDKGSTIKATFRVYHGEAIRWFDWIAMFHSLVHQTSQSQAEKLVDSDGNPLQSSQLCKLSTINTPTVNPKGLALNLNPHSKLGALVHVWFERLL